MLFGVSEIEVSLSTLTSGQPFPYYALGHIHKRQVLREDPFVAYSGALERVDFSEGDFANVSGDAQVSVREAEPKGFYRIDLVADRERWVVSEAPDFRQVRARRFVTIRLGSLDQHDPIADIARRIETARARGVTLADAFVRIAGEVGAADRSRITLAATRVLVPEAYDVRLALESHDASFVRDPRFAEHMSELEAIERYLATRDDWADDREALLHTGRELVAEVLERR